MAEPTRCGWAERAGPLDLAYHDEEWGVPVHDDRLLFELLTLEGAQAGLSWSTILSKREQYRTAFHRFDIERVARYRARDVGRLLRNSGIVRNRAKIEATIGNARAIRKVQRELGSFDAYIWRFVGGGPVRHGVRSFTELQTQTPESVAMSKELKRRGFTFVGPTICYAFMQAAGLVNDHETRCFRYRQV